MIIIGQTGLMMAKRSRLSNHSTVKLLEEAAESHVSPYLNNARYTHHGCFSLKVYAVPNE